MKDPVPGFSDTILGVLGIGVGAGLGIIRVAKAYNKSAMDMVPSDVVVNMLLVEFLNLTILNYLIIIKLLKY